MNQSSTKKHSVWPVVIATLVIILGLLGYVGYRVYYEARELFPFLVSNQDGDSTNIISAVQEVLGFEEEKTYLVLFLNNTELRPGGGFIGSYTTVRIKNGELDIAEMEGSENLDYRTPESWCPIAPSILKTELGVKCWYFRDSNWSPDFAISSQKALEFYKAEGGTLADEIDAVIAVTPTVTEELLKIVGPITVAGITFDADNVTETLEYEVEYGYQEKGIAKLDRKQIILPFMNEIMARTKGDILKNYSKYANLFTEMMKQKHIMVYSTDSRLSLLAKAYKADGLVRDVPGDYLLWVDANLAALKTDHAIKRNLNYSIQAGPSGDYIATAKMTYNHTGTFDWRTTRYRTYARIYVPEGAVLHSIVGTGKNAGTLSATQADKGEELGKQWFGALISIEPGETREVIVTYTLPKNVSNQIDQGLYTLLVQKQLGTVDHGLTLGLQFDTTIHTATPAEKEDKWGDLRYELETDLLYDREFIIGL